MNKNTSARETFVEMTEAPKILIVDDDSYFRELLRRLMTGQGYDVLEARSASEGEMLLKARPALAIIDYRLPNMDGAAWIKTLRERGVKFPIVFCSGSSYSSQTLANVRNILNVELIVRKPIDPNEFLRQMQSLLPPPVISPGASTGSHADLEQFEDLKTLQAVELQFEEGPLISDVLNSMFSASATETAEVEPLTDEDLWPETKAAEKLANKIETEEAQATAQAADQKRIEKEAVEALQDLSAIYLSELPEIFSLIKDDIAAAGASGDISLLHNAADRAHQVRGTAGSLGFAQISAVAGQLEESLNQSGSNGWGEQWSESAAVDSLISLLEALLRAASSQGQDNVSVHRILVVDDLREENDWLCDHLKNELGCQTRGLLQGLDIFASLESYQPTIVILKADLNGTTGADLCRMVRCQEKWRELPIFLVLTDCTSAARLAAFDCGATDYIATPIVPAELKKRLGCTV